MPAIVTVACSLPNGLLAEIADITFEDVQGQKIAAKENVQTVFFRGSAALRRLESNGNIPEDTATIVGGFGLTQVDAAFAERWFHENRNYPPVKSGAIYMAPKRERVADQAREQRGKRSGLEPLSPPRHTQDGKPIGELDPRIKRGANGEVPTTETVDPKKRSAT